MMNDSKMLKFDAMVEPQCGAGTHCILTAARLKHLKNFTPCRADAPFLKYIAGYIANAPEMTLSLMNGAETLGIGGFSENWDGVFTSWMIVSKLVKFHKKSVLRSILIGFRALEAKILKSCAKSDGIIRLQAIVQLDNAQAIKLNKLLGYAPEAVLRHFDEIGHDCLIMSKFVDVARQCNKGQSTRLNR